MTQRSLFGMNSSGFRMPVTVTKAAVDNTILAVSIAIEQIPGEDGTTSEKIDSHWLALMIEDKLLWKGAFIVVPNQGRMSLFRLVSVEPTPVAIGTTLTSIKVVGKDEEPLKIYTTSSLFGYGLNIQFKKGLSNFDMLAEALVKKGFTREDQPRGVGIMVPSGVDPDLMRIPSSYASGCAFGNNSLFGRTGSFFFLESSGIGSPNHRKRDEFFLEYINMSNDV